MSVPHWDGDGGAATAADPANIDRRTAWEKVVLGGVTMPGVAEVSVQQGRKIDDRGSPGRNGARLIDRGAEAAKVTIRLKVWTPEQLAQLQRSMPSLNYREERRTTTRVLGVEETPTVEEIMRAARASTSPQYRRAQAGTSGSEVEVIRAPTRTETRTTRSRAPLAIAHPMVVLAGITLVYVERIQLEPVRDGALEVRLECVEYNSEIQRRSRTAAPRPRAGAGANGDFTRPTAFDAPRSAQPAASTPATPPTRGNAGP